MGTGDNNENENVQASKAASSSDCNDAELQHQIELQDVQLKQIEDEQKQLPLVGDMVPFEIIIMEYDEATSPSFYEKAKELSAMYSDVRQIRGDGNCFFRAILVGITELITNNDEEAMRFLRLCEGWDGRLVKLGFPDWTTADFCDYFVTWVKAIVEKKSSSKDVFEKLNDDHHCNYLIIFLRMIASGYLKEKAEDYAPFIDNGQTLEEYCQSEIETMWKDVDHLGITGLVSAIEHSIRIEYMDRLAAPNGGWHYDFPPEPVEPPKITLLYRPGHYDIIYKREPCTFS